MTTSENGVGPGGVDADPPAVAGFGELVSMKELARAIGMDRSNALRYVKRMGYSPFGRRTLDSSGQVAATVTRDEAEAIIRRRLREGYAVGPIRPRTPTEGGTFYVIQLVPELAVGRVKLGFSADVEDRLQQHRTAAPTAVLIKSWPCRRTWEFAAMDAITRDGCEAILNEVFNCDDLPALLARGDAFFAMMPDVGRRLPRSRYSPTPTADVVTEVG